VAAVTERAGIYCRLSLARFGDTTKVDDQERICRELAEMRSWTVGKVYTDNSKSAWQRDRRRPGWDAMLADIDAGLITSLVVYHGDRLIRHPWDLEVLLNLVDQRGMTIANPTGDYQLDVAADRFVLRILTAKACLESDDTSRRKKAGFARMARKGIAPAAGGRYHRGFGYDTAGRDQVPGEADALREAAKRVLDGGTLTAIAADLAARGITSTSGQPMSGRLLKSLLLRPRMAGLMADGMPGSWPAIIEPEQQRELAEVLGGRAAGAAWSNTPAYLLSGIAVCWSCERGLQRQSAGRAGRLSMGYGCVTPGCRKTHRDMAMLDRYVSRRVVQRLSRPDNPAGQVPGPRLAGQIAALLGQKTETELAIADPAQGSRLGLLLARLDAVERRLAEARELAGGDAAARLRARHQGISADEFDSLPLGVRRSLVAACFRIVVLPASRRGPGFRAEDVLMSPR
jgi:DNA invertase Pin-like site-specific DNA recombinase